MTIRFGILGVARIVNTQINAMKEATLVTPKSIASRSLEKAKQAAKFHGISYTTNYDSLLIDENIDAIYIPLPNHLHFQYAKVALENGKHVLVDKPLTIEPDKIDILQELSDDLDLKIMEGLMYRFHPVIDEIVKLVQSKSIGNLKHMQLEFSHNIAGYLKNQDNYRYYRPYGGGALYDLGCYGIDLFRYLLEQIYPDNSIKLQVKTSYQQLFDHTDIHWTDNQKEPADEKTFALLMEKTTGITCQLIVSFDFHRKLFWISGDQGEIDVEHITSPGKKTIQITNYDTGEQIIEIPPANTYKIQFEKFANAIINDTTTPITLEQSRNNLEIVEQILDQSNHNHYSD